MIPDMIELAPGAVILVHFVPSEKISEKGDRLAYIQFYTEPERKPPGLLVFGRMFLPSDVPLAAQYHLFLHELVHAAAEMLVRTGATKRQPDEAFVSNIAGPLLYALGANGMLNGISRQDVHDWTREPAPIAVKVERWRPA